MLSLSRTFRDREQCLNTHAIFARTLCASGPLRFLARRPCLPRAAFIVLIATIKAAIDSIVATGVLLFRVGLAAFRVLLCHLLVADLEIANVRS